MTVNKLPYLSANAYYKSLFGAKAVKIPLDAGFTCPNRDGLKGYGGCIFCGNRGSGDFTGSASQSRTAEPLRLQFDQGVKRLSHKWNNVKYLAYFQAFTNTYAPVETLRKMFFDALTFPNVVGIAIATRPDCLNDDVLSLLKELNARAYVMVELGFQTSNEKSIEFINRKYDNDQFDKAALKLRALSVDVCAHIILGLPGETKEDMVKSVQYAISSGAGGVKLQLLHVLKDAPLYINYLNGEFETLSFNEYVQIVSDIVSMIPNYVVIHRLTGDGPRESLVAPLWSRDKKRVLNAINKRLQY